MNNVLAAIGVAQLESLDERLVIKRANFARYQEALGPSRLLGQPAWSESNRWFYALLCASAEMKRELLETCAAVGVQVRPLWWLNHLQEPYREMQAYRIERAPRFYDTVLNLPCSVSLTPEQIAEVVALVEAADPRRQATPV
jgi:perosamine synthetase